VDRPILYSQSISIYTAMEVIQDVTRYLFIKTSIKIHVFVGLTETRLDVENYLTVISYALHSNLSVDITIHKYHQNASPSSTSCSLLLSLFSDSHSFSLQTMTQQYPAGCRELGGTMSPLVGRRHHRLLSLHCRHRWTRRPRAICARRLQGCPVMWSNASQTPALSPASSVT